MDHPSPTPTNAPARSRNSGGDQRTASNGRHPGPGSGPAGESSVTISSSRSVSLERRLLARMLRHIGSPPVSIVLWDGSEVSASDAAPEFRVSIADRMTLWRVACDPLAQFGEGYSRGAIQVDGDFVEFLRMMMYPLAGPRFGVRRRARNAFRWHGPKGMTLAGSRENIYRHYDIGNPFYKLWLDERMLYTCAYFREIEMSLEDAQIAKMDHICRKLQLKPGETVIEAGCGWGGFALHMAAHYGVTVRAFNISREQILYARESARLAGLEDRVEFVEEDWREITGQCDAFVSVGMLEHVGIEHFRRLGKVIDRCLTPEGRGLIHSIGRNYPEPLNPWIERHIFPGAEPPALSEMMDIFEHRNFSVLDLENIRLHYAVTLEHWLARFDENVDEVRDMFDEPFVRMWRLYLASSMVAFECGLLQLFQVVFAPGRSNNIPWTRDYMYSGDQTKEFGAVWRGRNGKHSRDAM
ncbi:MAG: methyltransferase domain-containing protein [Planctomycetota bacterium]|nr:MAG: methyltransferase domain-containing protein [Planctomycetota bacterium]REK26760.1 MAG: methyltransferase domain-containing protein [Planctomycetota bacterium]REK28312.1 MAG: methyltransferase domain-containing protein [Planctomycetota bacterium]